MTERLADIDARIDGIAQLGAVVNAMRGIAAARAQQSRGQLAAVDAYAATIEQAIGAALDRMPTGASNRAPNDTAEDRRPGKSSGRPALLVFAAEQGFAGAFSERVLDAAGAGLAAAALFLVGTRGAQLASSRGLQVAWQGAMSSHSSGIPDLADRLCTALYARIAAVTIDRLDVLFSSRPAAGASTVERRRLFPLDTRAISAAAGYQDALIDLPAPVLLAALAEDYLHAQLCHAALHAFAAENQARMEAMSAAHSQIDRKLADMTAAQRRARQDQITAEIIELAAGEQASLQR